MKKLLIVLFGFICQSLFAQNESFTVSGEITGHDAEEMMISYRDSKEIYSSDKIKVSNGSFSYTNNNLGTMEMVTMSIIPKDRKSPKFRTYGGSSTLQLFIYPGANVKISGAVKDFVYAYPSGDEANNDLTRFNKSVHPLMNESVLLNSKVSRKLITDSSEVEKAKKTLEKIDSDILSLKIKFIRENSSSVESAWLLQDMMLRTQISNNEAENLFKNLNHNKLKGNRYYNEAAGRVKGISATGAGKTAPDISSVHTYDGKPFKLAALKGKYVILDFWGTWCGPCVSGMPRMKEYLDKYKNKMEIVGIASESDDGKRWREFLDNNKNFHWHHVLSRNDNDYIVKYSVAGFPTKIIIDPQGKVVARFVGEDDAIYEKLDEILK